MENYDKTTSPVGHPNRRVEPPLRARPLTGDTTPMSESAHQNIFAFSNHKASQHSLKSSFKPAIIVTSLHNTAKKPSSNRTQGELDTTKGWSPSEQ